MVIIDKVLLTVISDGPKALESDSLMVRRALTFDSSTVRWSDML